MKHTNAWTAHTAQLATALDQRGLTHTEIAQRTGCSQREVSLHLTRQRNLNHLHNAKARKTQAQQPVITKGEFNHAEVEAARNALMPWSPV